MPATLGDGITLRDRIAERGAGRADVVWAVLSSAVVSIMAAPLLFFHPAPGLLAAPLSLSSPSSATLRRPSALRPPTAALPTRPAGLRGPSSLRPPRHGWVPAEPTPLRPWQDPTAGAAGQRSHPWSGVLAVLAALAAAVRFKAAAVPRPPRAFAGFSGLRQPSGWRSPRRSRASALRSSKSDNAGPSNDLLSKPKPILPAKTPTGEFLQFILASYPHLFEESVQSQIRQLCEANARQTQDLSQVSESNMVLYKRINEVKETEERRALEDILYLSVLQAFSKLGVSTIEPHQLKSTAAFVQNNADRLVSMVHSPEEKEVVMAHMKKVLGPMMSMQSMFTEASIKMLKLQAFEMFASSLLFGYFLRHTYKRFALARSLGMLPPDPTQDVALLEALYEKSSSDANDPDAAAPIEGPIDRPKSELTLKRYIDGMNKTALAEQSYLASLESTQMVQEYLNALFGDVKVLMRQIQDVVNEPTPVQTPEEYTERMMKAVEMNKVDMLEISLTGIRRMILEAVAFGSFLKDAESFVEVTADRPLLTAVSKKPGQGPAGLFRS